jgi:Flp pilus assembly protein CpaB
MKQKNLILMAVAVGCGLVAAVLTARMNAGPAQVEKVSVLVPAKDLTVGMMITKEDVADGKTFTRKEMSKDGLPPGIVETEEELVDRRLARNYTTGEPIKKTDLVKGAVVSIPPGMQMIAQPFSVPQAVAGFVTPGSRVDILGTIRVGPKILAMPVLVNMLILAVDTNTQLPQEKGTFGNLGTVSFAVDQKQALVLQLARARGCEMTLLLRKQDDPLTQGDKNYDIDDVIKRLQDPTSPVEVVPSATKDPVPEKKDPTTEVKPPVSPAAPEVERVLVATEDIAPGTEITPDLLAKFEAKDLPKGLADGALDPKERVGKVLRTGLGKGQWVTGSVIGEFVPKPTPQDNGVPKAGTPETPNTAPSVAVTPAKRRYHDMTVHTANGTKMFRYEEVKPGEWRLVGEVRPGARTDDGPAAKPVAGPSN